MGAQVETANVGSISSFKLGHNANCIQIEVNYSQSV